jgi:hypothetical protein
MEQEYNENHFFHPHTIHPYGVLVSVGWLTLTGLT